MRKRLREQVQRRASATCEYCRMPEACDPIAFEIDHIIAQTHHGETVSENLALACFACNNHKGTNLSGRDLETNSTVTLYHPREDIWSEHFEWNGPLLVGRTSKGRATVDVLAINLPHRVAHREALIAESAFPQS